MTAPFVVPAARPAAMVENAVDPKTAGSKSTVLVSPSTLSPIAGGEPRPKFVLET